MNALSSAKHVTAEWQCTRCTATNRKFVARGVVRVKDRCVSCRAKHEVTPGQRPVRWDARAT
jgi:hypothetical protein